MASLCRTDTLNSVDPRAQWGQSFRHWLRISAALAVIVSVVPNVCHAAVEVVDIRWGYDGSILRNRFNLLSILVDNPHPEPFEGELWLRKRVNAGNPVDAPLVQPIYVGPFARRWVQFTPYVGNEWESFGLLQRAAGGRRSPEMDVPSPKAGWPARVIINDGSSESRRGLAIKGFPDILFPASVTATDGLQCVLLDSVPNWDEPRRNAFLHWLARGGVVFVCQTAEGNFPEFPDSLRVLRGVLEESGSQAGQIFRIPRRRSELTPDVLTEMFKRLPPRVIIQHDGEPKEFSPLDAAAGEDSYAYGNPYLDASDSLSGSAFLARLKKMTRPNHNWPLLHLMFWVYIALVFPGCWLIGRVLTDYRVVYLALLATVGVFSVLFGVVGQRGYGEATAVHSVAIIRPLPNGVADVAQWSNAFVTAGGLYEIHHQGTGQTYSTCNITEGVNGQILCGVDARFVVDIPPFSSREFAHRTVVELETPRIKATDMEWNGEQLRSLTLEFDRKLPEKIEHLMLLHQHQFYQLSPAASATELAGDLLPEGRPQAPPSNGLLYTLGSSIGDAEPFLQMAQQNSWQTPFATWGEQERPTEEHYRELLLPLIARSLNIVRQGDASRPLLPKDVVRVIYCAPLPEALFAQSPYLGKQEGWAVFAIDVPLPTAR